MSRYSLSHLADGALLRDLAALVATDRTTTASLLAHLAEVDARRLYRKQGCESLYHYCVRELKLSEDAAKKRIRAARTGRRFPIIFQALADGRLTLTAVLMLSRHLTRQNARELLAAAMRKSNEEIEALLASRFPQPDLPTILVPLVALPAQSPGRAGEVSSLSAAVRSASEGAARPLPPPVEPARPCAVPGPTEPIASFPTLSGRLVPLSAHSTALQVTVGRATQEKIQRARDLLGHAVPSGDLAEILDRALDALIEKLERRKFGATDRPRAASSRRPTNAGNIPADVRRAVWKRDGGQCTYVGSGGHRCESRRRLEFDHVVPVALGGETTLANLRLHCRAHNLQAAEETFGAGFLRGRVERAQRDAALARIAGVQERGAP